SAGTLWLVVCCIDLLIPEEIIIFCSLLLQQHAHIPKFGNWGSDGGLNYSQFFDKALRERSELKAKNMNHHCDNPKAFHTEVLTVHASSLGTSPHSIANGVLHLRGEDSDYQRTGRVCDGSDYRVDHSPTHPNYQMKIGTCSSEGLSRGSRAITLSSPGKLRMTGVQYDNIMSKGSVIPKFGDWDESNPSTADGFSRIFNRVREEKQRVSAKVSQVSSDKTCDKDHESNHEPSVCGFCILLCICLSLKFFYQNSLYIGWCAIYFPVYLL
ncbi:hypothetical protein BHE74_00030105, partial [Ensete ventricosum]